MNTEAKVQAVYDADDCQVSDRFGNDAEEERELPDEKIGGIERSH